MIKEKIEINEIKCEVKFRAGLTRNALEKMKRGAVVPLGIGIGTMMAYSLGMEPPVLYLLAFLGLYLLYGLVRILCSMTHSATLTFGFPAPLIFSGDEKANCLWDPNRKNKIPAFRKWTIKHSLYDGETCEGIPSKDLKEAIWDLYRYHCEKNGTLPKKLLSVSHVRLHVKETETMEEFA